MSLPRPAVLIAALACATAALAADDSRSPYDSNPACRDRSVNSAAGDCVIQDDGTPRHSYPPRKGSAPVAPTAPAAPAGREGAPASGRRGG